MPNAEFYAILVSVTGLFGYLLKKVMEHFINQDQGKLKYIETLVGQNQTNTENFINTVNHQRTLDREMQERHLHAIDCLTEEIKNQRVVNERILELFIKDEKNT